jgi:hypothetical protein
MADAELVNKIVSFINETGIGCSPGTLPAVTFLPGIAVHKGCIIYDPAQIKYPGDLLHEAGHLAVLLPEDRLTAMPEDMKGDMSAPGVEMAAIAWSWAALQHLGLTAEILFHKDGYKNDSATLIQNFSDGKYLGVPLLQWLDMTKEPKHRIPADEFTYPKMRNWLRPAK